MNSDQYVDLTREQLVERLAAAESVALVYGWCGVRDETEREKALLQLWYRWHELCPSGWCGPDPHPGLGDRQLAELADERLARDAAASMRLAALIGSASRVGGAS